MPLLDEEKDLNVELILKMRDSLSRGCECFMNHACDTALFVILTNSARIEFDVIKSQAVVTSETGESHR
jgi:hypothetical protein